MNNNETYLMINLIKSNANFKTLSSNYGKFIIFYNA